LNVNKEDIEEFSSRTFLRNDQTPPAPIAVATGNTITIDTGVTFEALYDTIPEPGVNRTTPNPITGFNGVNLFNYDVRSLFNTMENSTDVDIAISEGGVDPTLTFTDTADTLVQIGEIAITTAGTNVRTGTVFTFPGTGTSATVTFTDGVAPGILDGTIDNISELTVTNPGTAAVADAAVTIPHTIPLITTGDDQGLINLKAEADGTICCRKG